MIRAAIAAVIGLALIGLIAALILSRSGMPVGSSAVAEPSVTEVAVPPTAVTPRVGISAAWIDATATSTGIPAVALDAYALAAIAQKAATPACGLGWNTVAALGYAESAHGSIHGAHLDPESGELVGAILGPVLDGTRYNLVRDTDSGVLDGDTRYDRAVGPLQFLPKTWLEYGLDGNADGTADPNNVFDAARTAAAYLCSDGRSVRTGDAWVAAIRSYNPNESYVSDVLAAANTYAKG